MDVDVAKEMSWSWHRGLDEMMGLIKEWRLVKLRIIFIPMIAVKV